MPKYRDPLTLSEAIYRKNQGAIDQFIEYGLGLNDDNEIQPRGQRKLPLELALEQGNLTLMEKLIDAGADPEGHPLSPIICQAIAQGHLGAMKLLQEKGVSLEQAHLNLAVEMHEPAALSWLIEQGLDPHDPIPETKGATLLTLSLSHSLYADEVNRVANILMDAGVDPLKAHAYRLAGGRPREDHPISAAAAMADAQLTTRILKAGADPNLVRNDSINADGDGCPLIVSTLFSRNVSGRVDTMKALVDAGARLDLKVSFNPHTVGATVSMSAKREPDANGNDDLRIKNATLLSLAACWADPESVQYLIEQGVDIHGPDKKGQGPLHHFFTHLHHSNSMPEGHFTDILDALIEAGCDPNGLDSGGNTPLHIHMSFLAHHWDSAEHIDPLILAMLNAGADPHIENKAGKSALSYLRGNAEHYRAVASVAGADILRKTTPQSMGRARSRRI